MGCLVSPHTALPWGRGDAGKIAPLPLPTPMGTNSFLFLKGGLGTSPLGTWTSAEARSSTVTALVCALRARRGLRQRGWNRVTVSCSFRSRYQSPPAHSPMPRAG